MRSKKKKRKGYGYHCLTAFNKEFLYNNCTCLFVMHVGKNKKIRLIIIGPIITALCQINSLL